MTTNKFNEAEVYLLQNWKQTRKVENSIKEIRSKYFDIVEQLFDSIQQEHEEIDWHENLVKKGSALRVGKERWQNEGNHAYIGIEHIGLEYLLDSSNQPFTGIYVGEKKKPAMELKQIEQLLSAADKKLTEDELKEVEKADPNDLEYEYQLWHELPESNKLLQMLIDDDSQKFVDCLLGHFEVFAKFIPVLDEIFPEEPEK